MSTYGIQEVEIPKHILTIYGPETIEQGTTSPAPGAWEYEDGFVVSLSALPAAGWQFDYWGGDISSTDNPVTFTIIQDMTITAVFSEVVVPPEEYAVTISAIGSGTTDPVLGAHTITHGASLTITAYPAEGWLFSHWEGDISGPVNPVNIEVLRNISVVAVFVEVPVPPPKPTWGWALVVVIVIIAIIILAGGGEK